MLIMGMSFAKQHYKYLYFYKKSSTPGQEPILDLIFLHGFMGTHGDWENIVLNIDPAVVTKCNIYLFDLPGHGLSKIRTINDDTNTTLSMFQECLAQENVQNPLYIAYSMGGRIALSLANEQTKGLFLESCSLGIENENENENERLSRLEHDRNLFKTILDINNKTDQKIAFKKFLDQWYELPIFQGIKKTNNYFLHVKNKINHDVVELQKSINILSIGNFDYFYKKIHSLRCPIYYLYGAEDIKYKNIANKLQHQFNTNKTDFKIDIEFAPNCSHNVHFQDQNFYIKKINIYLQSVLNSSLLF